MNERIEKFHLSSDGFAVVTPHPQAKSKFAKQQGYLVLRFESGVSQAFRDRVVELMNEAQIGALSVWSIDEEMRIDRAREAFIATVKACGSDPMAEETAILSVGREYLPEFARVVQGGGEATAEYWEWLREQTKQAQAEHDREYVEGHEWHK